MKRSHALLAITIACILWVVCLTAGCSGPVAKEAPLRIMPLGDSITAGYTDDPVWDVPFEFGYRSGLYVRLRDGGYNFQFVGKSPEPWDGRWGVPGNTPFPDLRALGQDKHRGYGSWGIHSIQDQENVAGWIEVACYSCGKVRNYQSSVKSPEQTFGFFKRSLFC